MPAGKLDKNDFQARIKSIKNPRNTTYYDPNLGSAIPKRMKRKRVQKKSLEDTIVSAFLVSMIFGAFGILIGQAVRLRLFDVLGPGMEAFVIDLVVGFWAILMISAMADKRRLVERFAQVVGAFAMFIAGHNLIWYYQDGMTWFYTQEYIDLMLELTDENSVMIFGRVFSL